MRTSAKKRIGVLRGGTDKYYKISLERGADLLRELANNLSDKYKPIDILVDKAGTWHISGIPIAPENVLNKVDLVWNSLHPSFSQVLKNIGVPITGPGVFPSFLEDNREVLEQQMKNIGVNMPKSLILPLYQEDFDGPESEYAAKSAQKVFEKFSPPWIVRAYPADGDTAVHVTKTFPELAAAIVDIASSGKSVLVEELIAGKVAAVHSISGFRGANIYNMPLIETTGSFSPKDKENLMTSAKNIHDCIGAGGYLKSNFVLSPRRGIFLTSIECSPNLKAGSHFSKSCEAVSAKPHQVIEHILERTL